MPLDVGVFPVRSRLHREDVVKQELKGLTVNPKRDGAEVDSPFVCGSFYEIQKKSDLQKVHPMQSTRVWDVGHWLFD